MAAFVKGPMVMAADLGPAIGQAPRTPIIVGDDPARMVDAG